MDREPNLITRHSRALYETELSEKLILDLHMHDAKPATKKQIAEIAKAIRVAQLPCTLKGSEIHVGKETPHHVSARAVIWPIMKSEWHLNTMSFGARSKEQFTHRASGLDIWFVYD